MKCQVKEVPINLFQMHRHLNAMGTCLIVRIKPELDYISLNIPSSETHLIQDSTAWTSFDQYQFCPDENNPEKFRAFVEDLKEADLIGPRRRNYNYQLRMIGYLVEEIAAALVMRLDIRSNGSFYYGIFEEKQCADVASDVVTQHSYPESNLPLYEELINHYYRLVQIFSEHLTVIEQHSFLPEELDELN